MARISRFHPRGTRRRLPWRLILISLLSLGILAEGSYLLFFSPALAIRSLMVTGDSALPIKDVEAGLKDFLSTKVWGWVPRDRLPFFKASDLEAYVLGSFFSVAAVASRLDWLTGHLTVALEPRQEMAIWCRSVPDPPVTCYYIDKEGTVFAEAPQGSGAILAVIMDEGAEELALGQAAVEQTDLEKILAARDLLLARTYQIDRIRFRPSRDFVFSVAPGYDLIFTLADEPVVQVGHLDELMKQVIGTEAARLEYVDLRIGNKIFYRFRAMVE